MNWVLLILGIFSLLIVVRGIVLLEKKNANTPMKEMMQNLKMLPLWIMLLGILVFIPYEIWVLFGSPVGFEIIYIVGISGLLAIALCFGFYYRLKVRVIQDR